MSKLMKSLTLGVAAAAVVVASSTAYAFCPRGDGGYYKGGYNNAYYGDYTKKNYYKKSYYKKDNDKQDYTKVEKDGYEKPAEIDVDGRDRDVVEGDADRLGDVAIDMQSRIFEITDKGDCSIDECDGLTLRSADGLEIEVDGIEFVDGLYEGSSEEELTYHLAQNGNAVRGRLQEERDDDEITYSFICEKIYS